MQNVPLVECLDAFDDLSEDVPSDAFRHSCKLPVVQNILVEVTLGDILRDDVEIGAVLEVV